MDPCRDDVAERKHGKKRPLALQRKRRKLTESCRKKAADMFPNVSNASQLQGETVTHACQTPEQIGMTCTVIDREFLSHATKLHHWYSHKLCKRYTDDRITGTQHCSKPWTGKSSEEKRPRKCKCTCVCHHRPGRLIPCESCHAMIGPGCCAVKHRLGARTGICHRCMEKRWKTATR